MSRRHRGTPADLEPDAASTPEELFDANIGLADRLARRYSFGHRVDDDMRQVAQLGLLLAARRFDPELGAFVRFASVTIIGELKKYLRSNGWGVHVARSLQEDSITVTAAVDRLTTRNGSSPSVSQIGEHTGFEPERIVEALRVRDARFSSSVDALVSPPSSDHSAADAAILRVALSQLDDESRKLIGLRMERGLTQNEIGRLLGISQPQVHRRLKAALVELRRALEEG